MLLSPPPASFPNSLKWHRRLLVSDASGFALHCSVPFHFTPNIPSEGNRTTFALAGFITHILATIFLFIGEFSRDGHGWMDRGIDYGASRSAHVAAQYLMCLHYILSTLSSEGNTGELAPETPVEVGFSLVLMLLNLTLFSYILGEVSALVMKADDYVRPPAPLGDVPPKI